MNRQLMCVRCGSTYPCEDRRLRCDCGGLLDVQLDIRHEPLNKPADVAAFLESVKKSPPDGIIVAAASYAVPPALLEQLADGGRLVIPVGNDREQQLLRITRRGDRYEREVLGPVTFVPLLQGLA